ncbi:hypothetical protein NK8_51280 (plasmid) [Caballeronia sp. NK8]|nr:hypothetical protein NK8_51280 [Caballeronia sp. NK8]
MRDARDAGGGGFDVGVGRELGSVHGKRSRVKSAVLKIMSKIGQKIKKSLRERIDKFAISLATTPQALRTDQRRALMRR